MIRSSKQGTNKLKKLNFLTYNNSCFRPATVGASSSRAGTPSRSLAGGPSTTSVLAEADRRRELRNYAFSPMGAPAAYKYFSRAEYYNTTAVFNRNMASERKEIKTIKTEDLDMERTKVSQREHAIPGTITRDTTANIAGGKQVN